MNFEQLVDFIENKMRMSHVYQPVLIRALVESGGSATLRQLAHAFLAEDESQLLFYEDRIKKMPLPVLKKHGVVNRSGELVSLSVGKLDVQQRAKIRGACERRLQEFVENRGLSTWDYRLLESDPVPGTVYYQVLKDANHRCALCGATDRALHVDHIVPRSKKGTNDYENLQALCDKCNLSKGNRDDTDFRKVAQKEVEKDCVFCPHNIDLKIIEEHKTVVAINDQYPVTHNHILVIPRRHTEDFFSMTQLEREHTVDLIRHLKGVIQKEDQTVSGFNIGWNSGETAGQTIMHAHCHLIPRRKGDVAEPRGGIRGAIPEKMRY